MAWEFTLCHWKEGGNNPTAKTKLNMHQSQCQCINSRFQGSAHKVLTNHNIRVKVAEAICTRRQFTIWTLNNSNIQFVFAIVYLIGSAVSMKFIWLKLVQRVCSVNLIYRIVPWNVYAVCSVWRALCGFKCIKTFSTSPELSEITTHGKR